MATSKEELYMKKFSEVQERCEKLEAANAELAKENENLRLQLAQPRESTISEEQLLKIITGVDPFDKRTLQKAHRQLNTTCERFIVLEERMSEFCYTARRFCSDVSNFKTSVTPVSLALTGAVKSVLESTDIRMSAKAQADIDAKTKQITNGIKVSLNEFADNLIKRVHKEDDSIRLNPTFFYIMFVILFMLTAFFGITVFFNFTSWYNPDFSTIFWWCFGLAIVTIGVILMFKRWLNIC